MSTIREILRILFAGGMSYREIGRSLGVSHNTVRRYSHLMKESDLNFERYEAMNDTELENFFNTRSNTLNLQKPLPDFEYFHKELQIRGVTVELLWQEYREKYPDGYSYTHVARMYRKWTRKLNISMRQVHRAGEKLFVDYSGKRLAITNPESGKLDYMAEIFVAAIGASSKTYVEATKSQKVPDWLQSNANSLAYFGGVPAMIVPDNLKSAVLKNNRGDIKLNPHFIDFSRHYKTVIIPARPKKPKDKSKAEAAVRIVQMWILAKLRHHVFYNLNEANTAIKELLEVYNNKPFKKIKGSRSELFESIDKPALKPLPKEPYEYADWKLNVRVGLDYVLEYNDCFYMVPYTLVDQYVNLRATTSTIECFHKNRRVASHARLHIAGEVASNKDFMPASHKHYADWSPTRLIAWSQSTGESIEKVFQILLSKSKHPEKGFRACVALVEEAKIHGLDRVEAAAEMALQIKSPTLSSIRSILRTKRDTLLTQTIEADEEQKNEEFEEHENIRGANYYN